LVRSLYNASKQVPTYSSGVVFIPVVPSSLTMKQANVSIEQVYDDIENIAAYFARPYLVKNSTDGFTLVKGSL